MVVLVSEGDSGSVLKRATEHVGVRTSDWAAAIVTPSVRMGACAHSSVPKVVDAEHEEVQPQVQAYVFVHVILQEQAVF